MSNSNNNTHNAAKAKQVNSSNRTNSNEVVLENGPTHNNNGSKFERPTSFTTSDDPIPLLNINNNKKGGRYHKKHTRRHKKRRTHHKKHTRRHKKHTRKH